MEPSLIIIVSLCGLIVTALFCYVAFCCFIRNRRLNRERLGKIIYLLLLTLISFPLYRKFRQKVEEFARRVRDRNEKYETCQVAVTYPDPDEP